MTTMYDYMKMAEDNMAEDKLAEAQVYATLAVAEALGGTIESLEQIKKDTAEAADLIKTFRDKRGW